MTNLSIVQLEWIALSFVHESNLHRDENVFLRCLQKRQLPIIKVNTVLLLEILEAGHLPLLPSLLVLNREPVRFRVQRGYLFDRILRVGCSRVRRVSADATEFRISPSNCPRYLVWNLFKRKRLSAR